MEEKRFLEEDFADFLSELVDGQKSNQLRNQELTKFTSILNQVV